MELAAVLGVIWTLSLLSFLYSVSLSIPPYVNPLVLVCIMLAFLLNPLKMFRHEARFWLLKIIVSTINITYTTRIASIYRNKILFLFLGKSFNITICVREFR